jgi:kynurenine formamidase
MIFLSHILDEETPSYGNRNKFFIEKKSDISKGNVANDSHISTTVHIGTHIDMPYHFYSTGQTIQDYNADFWVFHKILIVEIEPKEFIINAELMAKLDKVPSSDYELLIVKTGIGKIRNTLEFITENFGFHPDLYDKIIEKFPKVRVMGFDSISVSSFTDRVLGREAHLRFLNPSRPLLVLEDMKLDEVSESTIFSQVVIAPMRIGTCDGLPCTVIGECK